MYLGKLMATCQKGPPEIVVKRLRKIHTHPKSRSEKSQV